jgi:pyruvate dehydrogenase E1 component beta subunit
MRKLNYAQAIREAHAQLLQSDPRVFVIGQGLWSPWYVGTSMKDLDKEFGRDRLLDCPVSENGTTGVGVGAALAGMRPIVVHPRMDFMLLAVDQIVNQASNWSYMFGGQIGVPVVIRPIVNRGGEQGAQHSQSMHALFAHVPGLKVVMPATPYDAKGLLVAAVSDGNPVLYIDDRWLYNLEGDVPEELYTVPIGKAAVRREGRDATVVASSYLVPEALKAAESAKDLDVEVIDVRSLKPLDESTILESIRKTGRLVVADGGWKSCGFAAEIAALAAEKAFDSLKAPVIRVTLPDAPAPTSRSLEQAYYFDHRDILTALQQTARRVGVA